jgi:hypothetical protein
MKGMPSELQDPNITLACSKESLRVHLSHHEVNFILEKALDSVSIK